LVKKRRVSWLQQAKKLGNGVVFFDAGAGCAAGGSPLHLELLKAHALDIALLG
jgi:hypothetical protein